MDILLLLHKVDTMELLLLLRGIRDTPHHRQGKDMVLLMEDIPLKDNHTLNNMVNIPLLLLHKVDMVLLTVTVLLLPKEAIPIPNQTIPNNNNITTQIRMSMP